MSKLDLSRFRKIGGDKDFTVMQHEDGHQLKIAHKPLTAKMRGALSALPNAQKMSTGGEPGITNESPAAAVWRGYNNATVDRNNPKPAPAPSPEPDYTSDSQGSNNGSIQYRAKGGPVSDPTQRNLLPGDKIPNKIEKQVVSRAERKYYPSGGEVSDSEQDSPEQIAADLDPSAQGGTPDNTDAAASALSEDESPAKNLGVGVRKIYDALKGNEGTGQTTLPPGGIGKTSGGGVVNEFINGLTNSGEESSGIPAYNPNQNPQLDLGQQPPAVGDDDDQQTTPQPAANTTPADGGQQSNATQGGNYEAPPAQARGGQANTASPPGTTQMQLQNGPEQAQQIAKSGQTQAQALQNFKLSVGAAAADGQANRQKILGLTTNAGPTDLGTLFNDRNIGGKFLTIASVILGGAGAGLTGKSNVGLDMLNSVIDNNIKQQQQNMQFKSNLLSQNLEESKNMQWAVQQTKINHMDAFLDAAVKKAAQFPENKQAQENLQMLGMMHAQSTNNMATNLAIEKAWFHSMPNIQDPVQRIQLSPYTNPEQKEKDQEEYQQGLKEVALRNVAMDAYNTVAAIPKNPLTYKLNRDAALQPALAQLNHVNLGRTNKINWDALNSAFPNWYTGVTGTDKYNRPALYNMMTNQIQHPTLKARYGIDFNDPNTYPSPTTSAAVKTGAPNIPAKGKKNNGR